MEDEDKTMDQEFDERQDEGTEEVPVHFDIIASPSDPTLQNIADQFRDKEIVVPDYQRRFVWGMDQSSRLIESFLLGLPVPQVFIYITPEEIKAEIIDGQQRLVSIKYFFEGFFGEETSSGNRKKFKLKGLKQLPEYNGLTFEDLPEREQRKLKQASLRMINIRQVYPDKHKDSVFHIFERLNTGGSKLQPQEIRNAISRGEIVKNLRELNENLDWRKIIDMKKPNKNERDVELILRAFSLFKKWDHYESPMLRYLNNCQEENKEFDSNLAKEFKKRFLESVSLLSQAVEKPFHPGIRLNTAAFDSVMTAVMENEGLTVKKLSENHKKLMIDEVFNENIVGGTASKAKLQNRIRRAKEILANGI